MAQLLSPPPSGPPRLSQLLPTVKCSNCNEPVSLMDLGEHVCKAVPPVPTSALTTRNVTDLLPTRLQGLVPNGRSQSPLQPQPPKRVDSAAYSQRTASPGPLTSQERASYLSTTSRNARADPGPSPLSRGADQARGSSQATSRPNPGPPDPRNDFAPPPRLGTPSARSASPFSPSRVGTPQSDPRGRTVSSPRKEYFEPLGSPPRMGTPSDRRPSNASAQASSAYNNSNGSGHAYTSSTSTYRHPSSPSTYNPPTPQPQPAARTPQVEIDTKIGGEAGMAGVGRRGFAAAARAAMFATSAVPGQGYSHMGPLNLPGMDGRRQNAPSYLDINTGQGALHSANTPPLSPNSGTHSSHSPRSPYSPNSFTHGFQSPNIPLSPALSSPGIAPSRTPSPPSFSQLDRLASTPTPTPADYTKSPVSPARPASPDSGSEYSGSGLAYADETDEEEMALRQSPISKTKPLREPDPDSDAEDNAGGGINQFRFPSVSDKSKSSGTARLDYSKSSSSSGSSSGGNKKGRASPPLASMPMRSISDASAYSSSRTASKSTGALERAMETLFEDPTSPTSIATSSSVPFPPAPTSVPMKLPTRSHTSPTLHAHSDSGKKKEKRARVCVRCERNIEDGRWVRTDGSGVLCERCWKNMYLPKCRRCNLPIEKHAVSSSDGQLKGKYHRECFNCHTCHKPFPDKTFYVLDGKPFCAYHYHEANDSLCAAATCGQPIEGPCALSHAGDRYHPEHLLCEYPRGCTQRLEEYYEVDGRMLCDRHAFRGDGDDGGEDEDRERRALKRTTRFIDLAGTGFGAGGLR